VATEWSLRPQLFTLFLLAVTALLVTRRRFSWLPLVFLLWANLHGGVMLGLVVVAAGIATLIIAERRIPVAQVIAAGLCALMTIVTPLGISIWTEIPGSLDRLRAYGVREWRPPSLRDPVLVSFWLLAMLFAALLAMRRSWRPPATSDALRWAALALFPVAMSASRNVSALAVILVPAVGGLIDNNFPRVAPTPARHERHALHAVMLCAMAVFAAVTVAYAWTAEIGRLGWRPVRTEAVAALAQCPGPLYNRYDDGGYLIWFAPDRKVFMDSRQDPYPPDLVQEHIRAETSGDYRELFRRYAIRCSFTPANSPLARRLTADEWRPVYRDERWVVLAR
jgi:hypothetical protein